MKTRGLGCVLIALVIIGVINVVGGLVMERRFFHTTVAKGSAPVVVRRPPAANYSFFNKRVSKALAAGKEFPTDFRSCDLSTYNFTGRETDLLGADFDSKTKWPAQVKRMSAFKPDRFMELGKDPGLGLRALHAKGVTGKGVSVAIIDYPLLVDHAEVKGRVRMYEEIHCADNQASMHGCATSSIAVGKHSGVAPDADLYFIAMGNFRATPLSFASRFIPLVGQMAAVDYNPIAKSVDRLVTVNRSLPKDRKIRVISISVGWMRGTGVAALRRAIERAENEGIFVITCSLDDTSGGAMDYVGIGREPLSDPNDLSSYRPGMLWSKSFYRVGRFLEAGPLLVPIDARCVASPTGVKDYAFFRKGGASWGPPYTAGLYALACQVKPDVTPAEFWAAATATADTVSFEKDGRKYTLKGVVNPAKMLERVGKGARPRK